MKTMLWALAAVAVLLPACGGVLLEALDLVITGEVRADGGRGGNGNLSWEPSGRTGGTPGSGSVPGGGGGQPEAGGGGGSAGRRVGCSCATSPSSTRPAPG